MDKDKINKPLVSILMAVYKPNEKWLIEQLKSLNEQTYENLELYIYDDCPDYPVDEEIIKEYIKNFKYELIRGKVNKGSNAAFENLTKIAKGEYLAYCDQDDIWKKEKIEVLINKIQSENSSLAYSEMSVIDEKSKIKHLSLLKAKPRIQYIYGTSCYEKLFFKNCISGCSMIVNSEIAKKAIPFSKTMVHDQWIATVASTYGKISFIHEPLVKYRMHGDNQTGSLKGINSIEDYYEKKVNILENRFDDFKRVIDYKIETKKIEALCKARLNKNLFEMFKYRKLCSIEVYFEIAIKFIPKSIINYMIKQLKK